MNNRENWKKNVCFLSLFCLLSIILGGKSNSTEELVLALGSANDALVSTGSTGGAYSLASISNRDFNGQPCLGFSDPQPDRILRLQSDFAHLTLEVNSNGKDTTLVVKSIEDGTVRCAFGQDRNRDAVIYDSNWSAGVYHVWVGSMVPNRRSSYRLSIKP